MDRRLQNHSSASGVSENMEQDLLASVQLLNILEDVPVGDSSGNAVPGNNMDLRRMLSLHSVHSTRSSNTEVQQSAQHHAGKKSFRKIGAGACGVVFAPDGEPLVFKFARTSDGMLWNEHQMHASICEAFAKFPDMVVRIPDYHFYIPKDDDEYLLAYPELREAVEPTCNLPTSYFVSERILPLPEPIRAELITKFCTPRLQQGARDDVANKDCLVRVYLGSQQGRVNPRFFSLRNFKLYLNQMAELNMDIELLAHRMARALSVMHWEAQTDARDVEFVLGSSAKAVGQRLSATTLRNITTETRTGPANYHDFFIRTTEFWVLDFNQVRSINLDVEGVRQALDAVTVNDPYFPRPLQESTEAKLVWNAFALEYYKFSTLILQDKQISHNLDLPGLFLKGLIDIEHKRMARN